MGAEIKVALLLGSNLGDRRKYLNKALSRLKVELGSIIATSGLYETEPWGMTSDLSFYNQAVLLETALPPGKLMQSCLGIERELGRSRKKTSSDRKIDIDILLYGDRVVEQKKCTIPHPRLHLRKFALIPLAEIAPDMVHPLLKTTVAELAVLCNDPLEVKKVEGIAIKT